MPGCQEGSASSLLDYWTFLDACSKDHRHATQHDLFAGCAEYERNAQEKQAHMERLQEGIERKKAHMEKAIQAQLFAKLPGDLRASTCCSGCSSGS